MSGGLAELVAIGAQDAHIVGNPEVSFFQSSYKRHSNFSSVIEREVIQGVPRNNGYSTIRFERKGDLLSYVYLMAKNSYSTVIQPTWSTIIDKIELYIGGQKIDSQDYNFSAYISTEIMANSLSKSIFGPGPSGKDNTNFFYPIKFWFSENWQSALPLIALQYHDVEMRIYWGTDISPLDTAIATAITNYKAAQDAGFAATDSPATHLDRAALEHAFKAAADIVAPATGLALVDALTAAGITGYTVDGTTGLITGDVLVDSGAPNYTATSLNYTATDAILVGSSSIEAWSRYVFLDEPERRMMSERPMDMLVHQVQSIPTPNDKTTELAFNHPIKFVASTASAFAANQKVLLQLNGTDVGEKKQAIPHYSAVSAYHHQTQSGTDAANSTNGYYSVSLMIPFCLDASKLQPTGTCNFSRMDSARLINDSSINGPIYAVNYNILRVQNGMGGLLYAN
jgi:hypothetical protein